MFTYRFTKHFASRMWFEALKVQKIALILCLKLHILVKVTL